jgi:hypothetical protein
MCTCRHYDMILLLRAVDTGNNLSSHHVHKKCDALNIGVINEVANEVLSGIFQR